MTSHTTHSTTSRHAQEWHVTQCACGHLTVRLGSIRLDFSRDEFSRLHELVQRSMAEFRIEPEGAPAPQRAVLTH